MVHHFVLVSITALLTHLVYNRVEPKRPFLPLAIIPIVLAFFLTDRFPSFWSALLYCYAVFILSLAGSVATYRLSFLHPLAKYPGNVFSNLTKWWGVWETYEGRHHARVHRLHQEHGPIVRVGPNEISIADVSAITSVLGSSGLPKGDYYAARHDPNAPANLIVLEGDAHDNRRRLWNRGMNSDSIKVYEEMLEKRAHQLVDRLAAHSGPVGLSTNLSFFTFDFLGDIAFGGAFNMIAEGDIHHLCKLFEDGIKVLSAISQVPWMTRYAKLVPPWEKKQGAMRAFGLKVAQDRLKRGSTSMDIWYHLSDEAGFEKQKPSVGEILSDGLLAVIAGTDTTKTSLSALFFCLLSNPSYYVRLQAEVDGAFPALNDPMDIAKLEQMPFLLACVNESMRMFPPVPTNGPRRLRKGAGPKVIAGSVIPEGTEIYVSPYQLHRNARYFSPLPDTFIPERWLEKSTATELGSYGGPYIQNIAAFIPFSYGPHNCAGKTLAITEIRYVACLLMRHFNLKFPVGSDQKRWAESYSDHFVATTDDLMVELSSR